MMHGENRDIDDRPP